MISLVDDDQDGVIKFLYFVVAIIIYIKKIKISFQEFNKLIKKCMD